MIAALTYVLNNLFPFDFFSRNFYISLHTTGLLLYQHVSYKKEQRPRLNGSRYTVWRYLGEAKMKINVPRQGEEMYVLYINYNMITVQ